MVEMWAVMEALPCERDEARNREIEIATVAPFRYFLMTP